MCDFHCLVAGSMVLPPKYEPKEKENVW